jgi:hypothetical protein
MKLVVGDDSYDLVSSVQGAGIGDLRNLKALTKGLLDVDDNGGVAFPGVTVKTFAALFEGLQDSEQADLASDMNFLLHMQALVWLAKRKAGEPVSFDDCGIPLDGFTFADDPTDEEASSPKDAPAEAGA